MFNKMYLLLTLGLLSFNAMAVSESNYAKEYEKQVVPVLKKYNYGHFEGMGNIQINYAHYASNPYSKNCIVILPGRSEPIEKYAELVESLDSSVTYLKYQYFLMDHRGQGSSQRMLEASDKGHIDFFENYTLDVKKFMDEVVGDYKCKNTYLLAHSMGAAIAIDFESQFPGYFKKLFLTSPMLKIQTRPYPYEIARKIVEANIILGKKNEFAPGQKPYSSERNFEKNAFTGSAARYEMTMSIGDQYPETQVGGVTNNWLGQVMLNTPRIQKDDYKVKVPVMVFSAGIETYSYLSEMEKFCQRITDCKYFHLKTSKHEILNDTDLNRTQAIGAIKLFFN